MTAVAFHRWLVLAVLAGFLAVSALPAHGQAGGRSAPAQSKAKPKAKAKPAKAKPGAPSKSVSRTPSRGTGPAAGRKAGKPGPRARLAPPATLLAAVEHDQDCGPGAVRVSLPWAHSGQREPYLAMPPPRLASECLAYAAGRRPRDGDVVMVALGPDGRARSASGALRASPQMLQAISLLATPLPQAKRRLGFAGCVKARQQALRFAGPPAPPECRSVSAAGAAAR